MIKVIKNLKITTKEFNKLTAEKICSKIKKANLVTKAHIDDFVEKVDVDDKIKNLNKMLLQIKKIYREKNKTN